jgi:hypothetical protein
LFREFWGIGEAYYFLKNFKEMADEMKVIGGATGVSHFVQFTLESFVWTAVPDVQEIWLHCDVSKLNN